MNSLKKLMILITFHTLIPYYYKNATIHTNYNKQMNHRGLQATGSQGCKWRVITSGILYILLLTIRALHCGFTVIYIHIRDVHTGCNKSCDHIRTSVSTVDIAYQALNHLA